MLYNTLTAQPLDAVFVSTRKARRYTQSHTRAQPQIHTADTHTHTLIRYTGVTFSRKRDNIEVNARPRLDASRSPVPVPENL